ncbi:MAG: RimK family protein [Bdellovibrio sp.]
MSTPLYVVTDKLADIKFNLKNAKVISARQYLTDPEFAGLKSAKVFNLCKSYRYQSKGYYVSLIAQARNHRVIPDALTIQDMKDQKIAQFFSDEIDELIQKRLKHIKSEKFTISVYFGKNISEQYNDLCKKLFTFMAAPLFRAEFERDGNWYLKSLRPIPLSEVPDNHIEFLQHAADEFFEKKSQARSSTKNYSYDLAILANPHEKSPPSNEKALDNFVWAAKKCGIRAEIVTKDDLTTSLSEYDALFIRETTAVNHYTYRLARRAHQEGLIVVDHPEAILRCANKVFLEETLSRLKIDRPKTTILHKDNLKELSLSSKYPVVMKQPDSAFSLGVHKASAPDEFMTMAEQLLAKSDLIIVQEFVPSEYDWRIGVLDNRPLFACKYFMAKGHWQIYNQKAEGTKDFTGNFETIPVELAPRHIVEASLKAAKAIGDGLFGIDIKQNGKESYMIEINDNPNIDAGVEDYILGDDIYIIMMQHFLRKLNRQRRLDIL